MDGKKTIAFKRKEGHAIGEAQASIFVPDFNRSIIVQTTDQRLTSNAGGIPLRDAEYRLGMNDSIVQKVLDPP